MPLSIPQVLRQFKADVAKAAMRSQGARVEWPDCSGQRGGLKVRQRRCSPLPDLRRASSLPMPVLLLGVGSASARRHSQLLSSRIWILPAWPNTSAGHTRFRKLSTKLSATFFRLPNSATADRFPA
jgi:hypothetical protein